MRNLYRVSQSKYPLSDIGLVLAFVVDRTRDDQIFFSNENGLYRCDKIGRIADPSSQGKNNRGQIHNLLLSSDGYNNIIAIEHLPLTNELCCASSDGKVWSYQLDTGDVEVVAFRSDGIEAMQWSPDQKLVVFVDTSLNVVTMLGADYESINEVHLEDDTFGDRAFMSVGWGKKETQFRGSEGKHSVVYPDSDDYGQWDRTYGDFADIKKSPFISWRADGEFFAVSFQTHFQPPCFKVFNKEGALQYTSERCGGLDCPLAWRPSGQWIAMPQKRKDSYVIALFEKNGLRHQEIPLHINPAEHKVLSLHWSPDSDILAVVSYELIKCTDYVFLYAMGNYHWYLKQTIYRPGLTYRGVQWVQRHDAGKTLLLLSYPDIYYERIWFDFRVDRSVGHGKDDEAMVAVIDGNRLQLSAFRLSVVPPPMCSQTITIPVPINAVGFIRTAGKHVENWVDYSPHAFFVVDALHKFTFYDFKYGTLELYIASKINADEDKDANFAKTHCLWLNPKYFVLNCNNICRMYQLPGGPRWWQPVQLLMEENETIGCIEAFGPDGILVELSSGRMMVVDEFCAETDLQENLSSRLHSVRLSSFCEQLFVDWQQPARTVYAFAQNHRKLYRDAALLSSEVTSVFLTKAYLLFTTITKLKFVPLGDMPLPTIVCERRLERGSKLVTVVPQASRTVLQLPRGNLEAINPRVLSLCLIAKHLDELEYYKAFDIMRKQRINLNLLVDHDTDRFLAHLGTHFLPQIANVSWLNLFITELANQDVCLTMYGSNYLGRQAKPATAKGSTVLGKVQFVCERLLDAMDAEPTTLTLAKITCHVKCGQPERALSLVWALKRDKELPEQADEALRYLLYLVEVNVLYDVALGMYDFGLVLFVATKSQKDPKEYLPFLNELKRLDGHYCRYRIDCHLKRYDRALSHIVQYTGDEDRFQETLELIVTHELYTTAVECFRGSQNKEHYRKVCERYGDYLRKGGKHAEASLMYERTGNVQQAISSARNALDWRRVLRLSARSLEPDAIRPTLRSLVPALVEAGEHDAAATIAFEHLKDSRLAVDCLLKDNRYERVLLLLASVERDEPDLQETVREHLRNYLDTFVGTLASEKQQFLEQKERLLLVRQEREKARQAPAGDEGSDGEGDCGDCDLFSDSSTVASSRYTSTSGRSGKSHRSSKNRRKHERKLLNLKKGNPFEDLALVDALHGLVLRVCGVEWQRNVRTLCQVSIELEFDHEARIIQREYGALLQLVRYSLDAIWIPEMVVPSLPSTTASDTAAGESGSHFGPAATANLMPADPVQSQNAQRYALLKPHQRYKPDIQLITWQWDILK